MAATWDPARGLSLRGLRRLSVLAQRELVHRALHNQDVAAAANLVRCIERRLDEVDDNPPTLARRVTIAVERDRPKSG